MNTNFLKRKGVKKVSQKCNPQAIDRFTLGGTLVAMGVVYGDIGTSPLYVMKAIVDGNGGLDHVSETFILGAVSLVFWTLTLLTTIKYVMIALNADNHGEGGIFSLFTLVRKNSRYLLYPAMLGGATLLADGILTPAVTVTTAVEGLRGIPSFHNVFGDSQQIIVIITVIIIFSLFMVQRLGTKKVGTAFGPIMFGWFTFIGLIGLSNFMGNLSVIRALNPYYAVHLLFSEENKLGILILGSVFLATTGAEALYSDLGHAGRNNIRVSWPYIKVCLVLNYFGQAAWIIRVKDLPEYQDIGMLNPFFRMMPQSLTIIGVIFATVAAIIASQSLISGSYTLASEAIKLRLLPRMKIIYPTDQKGQLYIPAINNMLMVGCLAIVFGFRTSARMEAAYGLAITITMLMTTILLLVYLLQEGTPKNKSVPKLIAVTQLTSTSDEQVKQEQLISVGLNESVRHYAVLAQLSGLDGVVCSAHEAKDIKQHTSESFVCLTPGIRLASNDVGDQKRVMTPSKARENGSTYIVVGRPITQAENPYAAYIEIKNEWNGEND